MKKVSLFILFLPAFIALQFCASSKKSKSGTAAATHLTYEANVRPIIQANCTPCHFPPKGNKKPYDSYASVKTDIDEIISRVQKNPGEKGFMPARHPKLPDSTIQVLLQWKNDGLAER